MSWKSIPQAPEWEYDDAPQDPGGALTKLWETSTNGIRVSARGEEIYTNCRHYLNKSIQGSIPNEINKTFWDDKPLPKLKYLWDLYNSTPSVAYSLRDLTGDDNNVVRVRRESDNTEKDFSGSQIESGEMARWVNEQPTLPLDLRELDENTGERDGALIEAAAAYSLRKLKEDFTGDVVEVRRNVDGETEGFTAAEVTDGTLEDWVGAGNDGYVKTWYDQSGNTNDATQTDPTKQPKIVDGGTLNKLNGKPAIFNNDTYLNLTTFINQDDFTNLMVYGYDVDENNTYVLFGANFDYARVRPDENEFSIILDGQTSSIDIIDSSVGFSSGGINLIGFNRGASNAVNFYNNGTLEGSDIPEETNGTFSITRLFSRDPNASWNILRGYVSEVILYSSDQSANRTAIEANIGETYGITDIPAANDTVNGFVQTWYDQSGSGNDVVQTTAANQPKIVIDGVRAVGGMRFDDNQFLETADTFTYGSGTTLSTFLVNNSDGDESAYLFRFVSDYIIYNTGGGGRRVFAGANTSAGSISGDEELWTTISELNTAGGTSNFYVDGTLESAADAAIGTRTVSNRALNIGGSGASTYWNGTVNEVILYDTDQSANRAGIEANILNYYNI